MKIKTGGKQTENIEKWILKRRNIKTDKNYTEKDQINGDKTEVN